jgi:site-specific recombinase XerD
MDDRIDIHGFDRRAELARASVLRQNPISKRNSELISGFLDHCTSIGLGPARVAKYAGHLKVLAELLGKDFDEADRQDIERVVARIQSSDYSPWTKMDYKVALKRFYKWLKGEDRSYPPEVSWIKTTLRERDRLLPSELPTEEEIRRLVEACDNPRDRAFIMTLYETGGRIGEVGSMRIKDVELMKDYAAVRLVGKTGSRRVPVVAAVPYLQLWIEHHPDKNNPNAPLWTKFSDGRPMTYPALAKVLKVAARRSGLKKGITPHKLRHARATFLASKLTEAQMNAVFGWKQGSDMPSTYVHLSGRDVDDAILGIYGLRKREEPEKLGRLSPRECPRCHQKNPATNKFCSQCGMALDMEAVMELEEKRREADELMSILLSDPKVRRVIRSKLKKLIG